MKTQSEDTHPEIEQRQIEAWRNMTDLEKAKLISNMHRSVWRLARIAARERHPQASEREIDMYLASLRLGRATMIEFYGWDPKEKGY